MAEKRPYVPPQVSDLGSLQEQAGAIGPDCTSGFSAAGSGTFCTAGTDAGGSCNAGFVASGGTCTAGTTAGISCFAGAGN